MQEGCRDQMPTVTSAAAGRLVPTTLPVPYDGNEIEVRQHSVDPSEY